MAHSYYAARGRRIMPLDQAHAYDKDPKHQCDRSMSCETFTYLPGERVGDLIESGEITIHYTLFWSQPRWAFKIEARDRFGDTHAETTATVFEKARKDRLEPELRKVGLIA